MKPHDPPDNLPVAPVASDDLRVTTKTDTSVDPTPADARQMRTDQIDALSNFSMNADAGNRNLGSRFFSPTSLAAFLGISKVTVYRMVEKRLLPFHKIGGSLRFGEADILRYLEKCRINSISL